jgi:chromosome segregation ATPase
LNPGSRNYKTAKGKAWQQIKRLTESLGEESKLRENAEQQLAEIGQHRKELESELAENKRVQAKLRRDLEKAQELQDSQQESSGLEHTKLEARVSELQVARADMEQQIKQATEALAEESKRREGAEQQAKEIGQHRKELEAELPKQTGPDKVAPATQKAHKLLQDHQASSGAEQSKLEARTKELQAEVEKQVKHLTQSLAEETKRREGAEQQAGEIGKKAIRTRSSARKFTAAVGSIAEATARATGER